MRSGIASLSTNWVGRPCRRPDGREIDQFDTDACVHIVGVEDHEVVSYTWLLPTTSPHLLSHVYPGMLAGATAPTGPDIWQWTRCAVDPATDASLKTVDFEAGRLFPKLPTALQQNIRCREDLEFPIPDRICAYSS
jgi:N-acyl-L-homoserine lactone synthetase